jgi:hypothetical protein
MQGLKIVEIAMKGMMSISLFIVIVCIAIGSTNHDNGLIKTGFLSMLIFFLVTGFFRVRVAIFNNPEQQRSEI